MASGRLVMKAVTKLRTNDAENSEKRGRRPGMVSRLRKIGVIK